MTIALPNRAIAATAQAAAPQLTAGRVAGAYLQPLLDAARARAITPAALAAAAGLAPESLSPQGDGLAADDYVRLLDIGAELAGDLHFGLHVGEQIKLGAYSVYGLILLSCRDFGQVFEQTARYEQLAHDLGRSSLSVEQGEALYRWSSNYPAGQRHLVDSVFAGIRVFGNWMAGTVLPVERMDFTHGGAGPGHDGEYERVLGVMPRFGSGANVARFDAQLLSLPIPNADVSLYPVLRQHAEQLLAKRAQHAGGIEALVHAAIVRQLTRGQAKLPAIAEELALSPRTLQRKLNDAGLGYQQVLDNARYALARDYLRQPGLSLADIAFLLGYSEQSAFHRAFKEWSGLNPGACR